jgi:hypothetical protein
VRNNDRKAILVAAACLVHCVAGPLLLSFAGFASLVGLSERIEPLFVLTSIALGSATLIPAYRKKHGRISCLAMFVGGLLCLLVIRRIHGTILPEMIAAGIGAGLIMGAHALNLKFSRRCSCCARSEAVEPEQERP